MTSWFRGYIRLLLTALLILSVSLVGAGAQKKKKRTRRSTKPAAPKPVITNPAIAPPTTGDIKIISTADQNDPEQPNGAQTKKPKSSTSPDQKDEIQQSITTLSDQVNKLNDKLTQMQEDDRYQLDMERLTRAEQRAEQVRMQLVDAQSKIADLEAKLEGVEYALRPENIERATQTYGSTRPEEARDARRRQLESERGRLKAQLKILETVSYTHLTLP